MVAMETPELRTDRLRLDPLRTSDVAEMVVVLGHTDLYRFTGGTPPTRSELQRRYAAQVAGSNTSGETWHNWIVRVHEGTAIGFVQATVVGDAADVAWLIGVAAQGQGHAGDAARAMCAWLTTVGVTRITAHIHPDHVASQRVATAVGLVCSARRDVDGEDIWTSAGAEIPSSL